MEMEQRGEQSISLSMSRIAEMATSAVTKREKVVKSSETERKERMDTSSLMEQILSSDNLNRAYLQVVRNKGAEGVDGMKYTDLKEHLEKNGENIKEQLRMRKYKPQPVRRVEIPKPDGGVRNLGVPTVTDRFIQQAIWFLSCQQRRCGYRCRNGQSNLSSSCRWQGYGLRFACVQHR